MRLHWDALLQRDRENGLSVSGCEVPLGGLELDRPGGGGNGEAVATPFHFFQLNCGGAMAIDDCGDLIWIDEGLSTVGADFEDPGPAAVGCAVHPGDDQLEGVREGNGLIEEFDGKGTVGRAQKTILQIPV